MRQLWLSLHVQGNHIRRLAVLTMLCVTGGYVLSCHGYEKQVARADETERILMTPLHVADKDTQTDVLQAEDILHRVAQQRKWQDKFYLYPIPEAEVWKIGQNFQNDGWKE